MRQDAVTKNDSSRLMRQCGQRGLIWVGPLNFDVWLMLIVNVFVAMVEDFAMMMKKGLGTMVSFLLRFLSVGAQFHCFKMTTISSFPSLLTML